jgi:glycogen operon protein
MAGAPATARLHFDGAGTNFSVFSEVAESVVLCLFEDDGSEWRRPLEEVDAFCWHAYLPIVSAGQRYGYRIQGRWAPAEGLWANPAKLLIDPYARAIEGAVDWDPACFLIGSETNERPTVKTALRTFPNPWSTVRISTGATIGPPRYPCMSRSSTKSTSRGLRPGILACPRLSEGPTWAWPIRPAWST